MAATSKTCFTRVFSCTFIFLYYIRHNHASYKLIKGGVPKRLQSAVRDLSVLGGTAVKSTVVGSAETARAEGTGRAYASQIQEYALWCGDHQYDPCLAQVRTLYFCHLWEQKMFKKLFMVKPALDWEFGEVTGEQKDVMNIVLDSARRCAIPVKHREKVAKEQVDMVLKASITDPKDWALKRYAVFLGFGFFALLRISEICAIRWSHLKWNSAGIILTVERSKTDQCNLGATVRIDFEEGSLFKSVFQNFVASVCVDPSGFVLGDRNGKKVSINSWRTLFKRSGVRFGITQSPHGLRGGGASFALAKGLPEDMVRRIGRWKTEMGMKPYIDPLIVPALSA